MDGTGKQTGKGISQSDASKYPSKKNPVFFVKKVPRHHSSAAEGTGFLVSRKLRVLHMRALEILPGRTATLKDFFRSLGVIGGADEGLRGDGMRD